MRGEEANDACGFTAAAAPARLSKGSFIMTKAMFMRSVVVFFHAEDGIRARNVTGVQTCALPISVPLDYDPLLAKLAAWAPTRDAAIERMKRALSEYMIAGIRTNRAFFGEIMDDSEFRAGKIGRASCRERAS